MFNFELSPQHITTQLLIDLLQFQPYSIPILNFQNHAHYSQPTYFLFQLQTEAYKSMAEFYNSLPSSDQEALSQLVLSSPAFKREFKAFFGKFFSRTLDCLGKKITVDSIFGLIKLERHNQKRKLAQDCFFSIGYYTLFLEQTFCKIFFS